MTETSANCNPNDIQEGNVMIRLLEDLLERDEDITARAVARLHPQIHHASSVTRSKTRADLLAQYQQKQKDIRSLLKRNKKRSQEKIAEDLAKKDQRITELEKQVEVLTTSHIAMIRVVGELGGMSKWLQFFKNYRDIRDSLQKLGTVPSLEEITLMPPSK